MVYSEIADILLDYTHNEMVYDENILLCIDNYIEEIENSPDNIIEVLKDFKQEYIDENNICPICYSEMITTDGYDEENLEYNGFPTRQKNYIKQCKNCGKILNDF